MVDDSICSTRIAQESTGDHTPTEQSTAQHDTYCNKIFVRYILSANEQQQHLHTDLLEQEELVISISFGRVQRWPRKDTLGNSLPSFSRGQFTLWSMKSPGRAPSRDMGTVFHILSYQAFSLGQQLCDLSFHDARLFCKEHFIKRELYTLQQRIIYLP